MKHIWSKFKESRAYRISKIIMDSASVAMIISIAFFAFEFSEGKRETQEVVDNLVQIQNSLSTRYLGLFPEYISNINTVLEDALEHQMRTNKSDTVIIFEDVLYYGIRSDAAGFRQMYQNIMQLAANGCHITIAYYDTQGTPFSDMVRDGLIDTEFQKARQAYINNHYERLRLLKVDSEQITFPPKSVEYQNCLFDLIYKHFPDLFTCADMTPITKLERERIIQILPTRTYVDSLANERYFDSTKVIQKNKVKKMVKGYRASIPLDCASNDSISLKINQMCLQLHQVMNDYMGKSVGDITFADFKHMYCDMTATIVDLLKTDPNIELLPLNETLLMSCWLTKVDGKEQTIFAFPSKYSTDEIGFISQDEAIAKYIHTMMNGMKNTIGEPTE